MPDQSIVCEVIGTNCLWQQDVVVGTVNPDNTLNLKGLLAAPPYYADPSRGNRKLQLIYNYNAFYWPQGEVSSPCTLLNLGLARRFRFCAAAPFVTPHSATRRALTCFDCTVGCVRLPPYGSVKPRHPVANRGGDPALPPADAHPVSEAHDGARLHQHSC